MLLLNIKKSRNFEYFNNINMVKINYNVLIRALAIKLK